MLVRFRQDVISLRPAAVVILAGTNDIAGNTGPMSLEDIQANYATLAELARVHGIRVVLSSVIPVHNYTPASELTFPLRPPEKIAALNKWLADYAARRTDASIWTTPPRWPTNTACSSASSRPTACTRPPPASPSWRRWPSRPSRARSFVRPYHPPHA